MVLPHHHHYLHEMGVLSMWDVIAEEFGFMLLWGDLVLVPFFYCIGGWWLVGDPRGRLACARGPVRAVRGGAVDLPRR
jgi:Ergosterol biosynthesis ERG4/ERG24 family